ncbi:MAG: cytochrome c maturation protein CcmE [Rickettsiella sp.]|nr:cytochrome c maturation protein CcmE [Rickettsiella sp.]
MNAVQKKRLYFIVLALVVMTLVVALSLYALKQNINLFYTPTQVAKGKIPSGQIFRLGGEVKRGTIKQDGNSLQISFVVSDPRHNVLVEYEGVLPDLFREGQSVVVEGSLDHVGIMQAKRVLAKHDERYKPIAH